jgi:protease secretion system outer membrane protein
MRICTPDGAMAVVSTVLTAWLLLSSPAASAQASDTPTGIPANATTSAASPSPSLAPAAGQSATNPANKATAKPTASKRPGSQRAEGKPTEPPAARWWLMPVGDRLNRGIDSLYSGVGRAARWDIPLGERLNAGLDNLFAGVSLLVMRPADGSQAWWEKPLADRLNERLDNLRRIVGSIERRDVTNLARALGVDGPVIWPDRVLSQPDAVVDPDAQLGLMQAWRAAQVNDPTLRAARAGLAAARERLPQARSQLLPQVQASVSRVANDLSREGQNAASQELKIFDRYPSANDTLTLRQPLLRAQQVVGIRQAQAQEREAEAIFSREEQEFSSKVVMAYLEVLLAQDNQRLVESQRDFLESALLAAKRALERGMGTRTDVDAAQAKTDLNRAQALQVRQQIDFARRQLQTLINRPFGELRPVDGQKLASLKLDERSLADWVKEAEASSPEVRRLSAQRDGIGQELNRARAGHLPTLDFVAQMQRSRSENTLSPQSQYQNRSVGVQLTVPLYNGGYVNSVVRQASAEIERIEETLAAARLDLGVRVHREYRGVSEGMLRVHALEVAVRSAEVALDSARKSMQAGVRTAVDVLNAEQQLSEARRNLSEARYTMVASLARLHTLAGVNGESLIQRLDQILRH